MKFDKFAEIVSVIHSIKDKNVQARVLSREIGTLEDVDLAPFIYLLQGRIGATYRPAQTYNSRYSTRKVAALLINSSQRQNKRRSSMKVESDTQSTDTENFSNRIVELYGDLHNSAAEIEAWLLGKSPFPPVLHSLSSKLDVELLDSLAKILVGSHIQDATIIRALHFCAKPAIDGYKIIDSCYRNTIPDLGLCARLFRSSGYEYWSLLDLAPQFGIPIKPQEISTWHSVDDAYESLGSCFVQPKTDGWQVQIHKKDDDVLIFSRKLEDWTSGLPDVIDACRKLFADVNVILDCEVLGYERVEERILPRKQTFLAKHHKLVVFDLIALSETDCRNLDYISRRRMLSEIVHWEKSQNVALVEENFAYDETDLKRLFRKWMDHPDYEGVIAISPVGKYHANTRTLAKGKLKWYESLDMVVIGYNMSPKGILKLAVGLWENEGKKRLVPVGIVEGGIATKSVHERLVELCEQLTTLRPPEEVLVDFVPINWVKPSIVVEVRAKKTKPSSRFRQATFELDRKTKLDIREDMGIEDADLLDDYLDFRLPPGFS